MLQKSIRSKNNEVVGLKSTIEKMTLEIKNVQDKLDATLKEKATMISDIIGLNEWKSKAEAAHKKERDALESTIARLQQDLDNAKRGGKSSDDTTEKMKQLQDSIATKESDIKQLKRDLLERDEDVNSLVPEVSRLQELNAKLSTDFVAMKAEFDAVSKKNEEITALKSTISDRTKKIADLESRLASISNSNSKVSSDLAKLEDYRKSAEKDKNTIASMKADFQAKQTELEKKLKDEINARIEANKQFEKTLFGKDGEISRLKKDLSARGDEINSLKAKLTVSDKTNQQLSNDIAEFKTQRYSSEAKLKKSADEIAVANQEVQRLTRELDNVKKSAGAKTIKMQDLEKKLIEQTAAAEARLSRALSSKDTEVADLRHGLASKNEEITRLNSGIKTFASERERLLTEVNKLSEWKSSAEATIADQCKKIDDINSQLKRLEDELQIPGDAQKSSSAQSIEYEKLLKERNTLVEQLAGVKSDLVKKGDEIKVTKMKTDALLKQGSSSSRAPTSNSPRQSDDRWSVSSSIVQGQSSPTPRTIPPNEPKKSQWVRNKIVRDNVVVGEFSSRRRVNVGSVQDVDERTPSLNPFSRQKETAANSIPASTQPVKEAEQVVSSPTKPPTLSQISSSVATAFSQGNQSAKTGSSNTMDAYNAALSKMKQEKTADSPAVPNPAVAANTTESKATAMSGWAGYKNSRFGGYLDNLSSSNQPATQSRSSTVEESKETYLEAEKKFLLEAKSLALVAAKSFEEARTCNDAAATKKANDDRAKVDDLLEKAKEMRKKADDLTKRS